MVMNDLIARTNALDLLLFDACDSLQLSPTQHRKAVDRYHAIAKVISAANSPFSHWESNIYSQGSMRLRTTVKPIDTPHDLDLVCELDVSHGDVYPMASRWTTCSNSLVTMAYMAAWSLRRIDVFASNIKMNSGWIFFRRAVMTKMAELVFRFPIATSAAGRPAIRLLMWVGSKTYRAASSLSLATPPRTDCCRSHC